MTTRHKYSKRGSICKVNRLENFSKNQQLFEGEAALMGGERGLFYPTFSW